jgi:hypothetical protein
LALTIDSGFTPSTTDMLALILNNGTSTTDTVFSLVNVTVGGSTISYSGAEGTILNINNQEFKLSYTAGIGSNDVELLAVPEPATWAMLVSGLGTLVGLQRMRRRTGV